MKLLVLSIMAIATTTLFVAMPQASDKETPPPCICKGCNGQVTCDRGQWSYCECVFGTCKTQCKTQESTAQAQALAVVSGITGRTVTDAYSSANRQMSSELLSTLLKGKVGEGQYSIKYQSRTIGFSFSPPTLKQLEEAQKELGGRYPIMY